MTLCSAPHPPQARHILAECRGMQSSLAATLSEVTAHKERVSSAKLHPLPSQDSALPPQSSHQQLAAAPAAVPTREGKAAKSDLQRVADADSHSVSSELSSRSRPQSSQSSRSTSSRRGYRPQSSYRRRRERDYDRRSTRRDRDRSRGRASHRRSSRGRERSSSRHRRSSRDRRSQSRRRGSSRTRRRSSRRGDASDYSDGSTARHGAGTRRDSNRERERDPLPRHPPPSTAAQRHASPARAPHQHATAPAHVYAHSAPVMLTPAAALEGHEAPIALTSPSSSPTPQPQPYRQPEQPPLRTHNLSLFSPTTPPEASRIGRRAGTSTGVNAAAADDTWFTNSGRKSTAVANEVYVTVQLPDTATASPQQESDSGSEYMF